MFNKVKLFSSTSLLRILEYTPRSVQKITIGVAKASEEFQNLNKILHENDGDDTLRSEIVRRYWSKNEALATNTFLRHPVHDVKFSPSTHSLVKVFLFRYDVCT